MPATKVEAIQIHVACAESGPYVDEARAFLEASEQLGVGHSEAYGFKCQLALSFFHLREKLEAIPEDPVPPLREALVRYAEAMRAFARAMSGTDLDVGLLDGGVDVATLTAEHYGGLFAEFSASHYFQEPVTLLRQRLERNGFPLGSSDDGLALDAGCGSGRYAVAMRSLGFSRAIGVDFSPLNIEAARQRCEEAGLTGLEYRLGNVLDLPVEDASSAFVLSNGVLHHTGDVAKGLGEIFRVLRPGGIAYLKLIPNPGGIYWDTIELLRHLMRDVPSGFARRFFALAGVPANRRYYFLDHVLVPINERLTAQACDTLIAQAGFREARRCVRGADMDRLEQCDQGKPFCREKYGDGVNLYCLVK